MSETQEEIDYLKRQLLLKDQQMMELVNEADKRRDETEKLEREIMESNRNFVSHTELVKAKNQVEFLKIKVNNLSPFKEQVSKLKAEAKRLKRENREANVKLEYIESILFRSLKR